MIDPTTETFQGEAATSSGLLGRVFDGGGGGEEERGGVGIPDIEDALYPALVECFGIIFLGYIAGRFGIVSSAECKGMGTFVSNFALPALVFGSLCRLDFTVVDWTFLLSIFIAKAVIFFLVLFSTLFAMRRTDPARAGIFAIFTTQSNDFALGYPILLAIYGHTHPEFPMYLYLMAPISLVILNPIGFICMEAGSASNRGAPVRRVCLNVAKGIATDPIIGMTLAGIVGNFAFGGSPPALVSQFLTTMGSAFSATALFLLGVQIVGNRGAAKREESCVGSLLVPFILVTLKSVALPIVAREITIHISSSPENKTEELANFAFLYGTFPVAPSVFVFASRYDVAPDMVANSMVFSTALAAPIMFVSAKLLSIDDLSPEDYIPELDQFLLDVSVIGIFAAAWVAFVLGVTRKALRIPYFVTAALVVSQGIACLGAILWSVMSCTHGWRLYLQFVVLSYGIYASRINTALLAIVVCISQTANASVVASYKRTVILFGIVAPAFIVASLVAIVAEETPKHGGKTDPNFQYGSTTAVVVAFTVTVLCLIIGQRYRRRQTRGRRGAAADETARLLDSDNEEDSFTAAGPANRPRAAAASSGVGSPEEQTVPIEDIMRRPTRNGTNTGPSGSGGDAGGTGRRRYRCDTEHREYCSDLINCYDVPPAEDAMEAQAGDRTGCLLRRDEDEAQTLQHMMLLVLLSISMFIGIALCIWTLVMDTMTGIYLELVFLDGFLNFGQSFFSLFCFGFDDGYVLLPLRRAYRRLRYGADSLVLPPWEDLDAETKQLCERFLKHHISRCMEAVLSDVRVRLTTYRAVFRGSQLVDWLLEVGLVRDRIGGQEYGRHLVKGRVIRHVDSHLDFYDDLFLYTFAPAERQ